MTSPWDAWRDVASREWQHELAPLGGTQLSEEGSLEEVEDGRYRWVEESLWQTAGGLLFARRTREASGPDRVFLITGADANALVAEIKSHLGMPAGRIEVLGRGGIEIGLEPDNEIEGDELEGPIPD